jgi:DNA-binding CsgD family transcriptional regulator
MHTGTADQSGDAEGSDVRITSDDDGAVLHVAVHGRWDWRLSLAVRTTVNSCLAERPTAVIVNLHAADDPSGSSAPLLVMAHRVGRAMQPRVSIAVCVPPGSQLESRLRTRDTARFLPVFSTVPQARAALDRDLAVPDRMQLDLPPLPRSPEQARGLVAEAGRDWALRHLVHPAELVMSELVTNAVQHAGTDLLVTVSRRGAGLYLAVRDGSTVLPPLPSRFDRAAGTRLGQYGYGLWLVDQLAAAWGARPTHQRTSKVVWAVVRPGPPGRQAESLSRLEQTPYLPIRAAEPMPQLLPRPVGERLSAREQEILTYLPTMLTAEGIATRLYVSVSTVKAHMRSIYRKLGVSRRQEAVAEAIERGLL